MERKGIDAYKTSHKMIYIAPLVGAGLVSGISGIVSNIFGASSQSKAEDRQRAWNEKMYQRQFDDNLRLWQMQNEYNDPSAQMERLKAAGLNPNLVYGKGAGGNSAGVPNSPEVKSLDTKAVQWEGIANAISSFMDLKMKAAQVDNVKAQTANAFTENYLRGLEETGKNVTYKDGQFYLSDTGLGPDFRTTTRKLKDSQADYNRVQTIQRGIENRHWDKRMSLENTSKWLDNMLKTWTVNIGNKIPLGQLLVQMLRSN